MMNRAFQIGLFALLGALAPPLSLRASETASAANAPVAKKVAAFQDEFYVSAMAFNHDGTELAVNFMLNGLDVHVWDWRKLRLIRSLRKLGGAGEGRGLTYSPDGSWLAAAHSASEGQIATIWNTHSGAVAHTISQTLRGDIDGGFAFSSDGKLFLRTARRAINLPGDQLFALGTDTWEPIWSIRTAPFEPYVIAIASDSSRAVLGGGMSQPWPLTEKPSELPSPTAIVFVDLVRHSIIRTIRPIGLSPYQITAVAWSPDGRYVAAGVVAGDNRYTDQVAEQAGRTCIFIQHAPAAQSQQAQ